MADIKSPQKRSQNMSAIRSKNTKPELYLRKKLFARGYRYRVCPNKIPGHPDIYLKKYNTAIFVHGCFWHRHSECKYAYIPKSNQEFWKRKFAANIDRDAEVRAELANLGIRYLVIWECVIKKMSRFSGFENEVLEEIDDFLHGNLLEKIIE